MYTVRILEAAVRGLERLDKPTGRRILARIQWLAQHLDMSRAQRLRGELAGFCKLRVGDWRVVYQILRRERVLLVHFIGHRSEVYRKP